MGEADKIHVVSAGKGQSFLQQFADQPDVAQALEAYKEAVRNSELTPPAKEGLLGGIPRGNA